MNVLISFHECSFKHTEMAWLVKPNVKGTAIQPKFTRELEPWEGTVCCGRCWDVSQTPSQFYLQGTQALLTETVITKHLVWCEKSASLLQLPDYSLLQPGQASWGFISCISCLYWDLLSVLKGAVSLPEVTRCLGFQKRSGHQPNSLFGCPPWRRRYPGDPTSKDGFGLGWILVCL